MNCEFSRGTEINAAPEVIQLNLHTIRAADMVDSQLSWQCQQAHVGRPSAHAILSFLLAELCQYCCDGTHFLLSMLQKGWHQPHQG